MWRMKAKMIVQDRGEVKYIVWRLVVLLSRYNILPSLPPTIKIKDLS